jgi:CubicO group peptidase (beta-lactamase class C family)
MATTVRAAVEDDGVPASAAANPAEPGTWVHADYVDGIATGLLREHGIPGLVVAVVQGGRTVFARGYGHADVASARAVDPEQTLFRIGSVSKTFVWTSVMLLVERGQIDLDADVNRYLKSLRVADAFDAPVSVRQLMHHRGGFEDSFRLYAVRDDDRRTLAELLAAHQPARVHAPGTRTSYSNWGAALAAQLVADVAGEPYGAFLERELLQPLGMRSTVIVAPAAMDEATRARLAQGYATEHGALEAMDDMQLGAYWPAGGIASTATDMARWARFHLAGGELDGQRLLSADTHARMWTRGYADRPTAADLAHGFQDRPYRGLRVLGHGGATATFFTNLVLVPELGLGIFVSQSGTQSRLPVNQLPDQIIDRIRGHRDMPALAQSQPNPGFQSDLAGTYMQNRRVRTSFAAVFGLAAAAQVLPLSTDAVVATLDGEARQYLRVDDQPDVFEAANGDRIAFLREQGQVTALADPSGVHTLDKVAATHAPTLLFSAVGASVVLGITTLLGFWWRIGRGRDHGRGRASRLAAGTALIAALCTLGFAVTLTVMLVDLSTLSATGFADGYPRTTMWLTHYAGWLLALATTALWLAVVPAWRADGWRLLRRLHYTVCTVVLTVTVWQLWQWRVIGAPVY